ncbi:hypothetical protein ACWN8V_13075 [Vagococcus elongatus]|nr:hypothetical protein [Vagococcus elongatus]
MKNIGNFFYRRKMIILISILVALIGGILYNMTIKSPKNTIEQEKIQEVFVSEFGLSIESSQGQPYAGIAQLKTMLVNEDQLEKISDQGIQIESQELEQSVSAFVRTSKGEVVFIRVTHANKEYVNKISAFLYNQMFSDDFDYIKNKVVLSVMKPTQATSEIPIYDDIYSTTDKSMLPTGEGATVVGSKKISSIVFILVGLIFGIILSLVIDIFNKKIYSIGYIEGIVDPNIKIIDASFDNRSSFLNRVNIVATINENEKCLALLQEGSNSKLFKDLQENEEIATYTEITAENLKESKKILLFVEKSHTTIDWLTTQISLLQETDKKIIVFFFDTYH